MDDEVIVEGSDDDIDLAIEGCVLADKEGIEALQRIVEMYTMYMPKSPAYLARSESIEVSLMRDWLPLSLQSVFGFLCDPKLLDIKIELCGYSWRQKPQISIEHPKYKKSYVGSSLVNMAVDRFFNKEYVWKANHRSAPYLMRPTGRADQQKVSTLVSKGFAREKAEDTLVLTNNDLTAALRFLKTGQGGASNYIDIPSYDECPLLHLVLEIGDAFLDLTDHCCNCGANLTPGLKPCVCEKPLCKFQLEQLGIGNSVVQEIRRDPIAADFVLSMFSAARHGQFLNPAPPPMPSCNVDHVLATLPAMEDIARNFTNDNDLKRSIGSGAMDLLRWVLLSNRSQLISLPHELKVLQVPGAQFMTLFSTPEAEQQHISLNQRYGSLFLFHGSSGDRWHSIFRNGLKNASGTSMQQNGAFYGSGIYFASDSSVSFQYTRPGANGYAKSTLGRQLSIMSLCDVAKVPELKSHCTFYTLQNEEACIVRFMFVGGQFNMNTGRAGVINVPTLTQVLEYHAEMAQHR